MHKMYFLLESRLWSCRKTELRTGINFSPIHRCFTLLPSKGKSAIGKALNKQSIRLGEKYVIVTQLKTWIDALVEGGTSEYTMKHGEARLLQMTQTPNRFCTCATHRIERTRSSSLEECKQNLQQSCVPQQFLGISI
jgi:hypothetical protein